MTNLAKQTVVRMQDFRAGEVADRLSKRLSALTEEVSGKVRANPWQAAGAMALAGVAAGFLAAWGLSRARRKVRLADSGDMTAVSGGG
jgi:ElaB/YqjD/DUF883 family membrane-anchored ribosome-binding protein